MSYPPIAFPPPPPTSNARSSQERAALLRSSKKLSKLLGDVPRVPDDVPTLPEPTGFANSHSIWRRRKPAPPLLKLSPSPSPSPSPIIGPDSPVPSANPFSNYHHRGSVLSIAPSIVSNAPSTASGSSDAISESTQRRTKLERLRRKLGDDVPATAVFSSTPYTALPRTPMTAMTPSTPKRSPRGRTRSIARLSTHGHAQADDARSVAFSINSDESVHRVTLSARVRVHSPHPPRTRQKHIYQTGALPPVPPIPARFASSSLRDDEDAGLMRSRQKVTAGSKIGGSDFKAARRAKREGRSFGEPGEMVEMVGFGW